MSEKIDFKAAYNAILDALDSAPIKRQEILSRAVLSFGLPECEMKKDDAGCRKIEIIAKLGSVLNAMLARKIVLCNKDGFYIRNVEKPVAIRIEHCEEEILRLLDGGSISARAIREALTKIFRTDETRTDKDDNRLMSFTGQILKRLVQEKIIAHDGKKYSLATGMRAEAGNRLELVALRGEFLILLHVRGGEFFENYFMKLLEKYMTLCKTRVSECRVLGGADDGGIDGIAKTEDELGFKETILLQMKNRNDFTSETDVRGFWGAVSAQKGTRGIFATTSDFHPMAKKFIDGIDNCIGINGEDIFNMACKTSFGIIKKDGALTVDRSVI